MFGVSVFRGEGGTRRRLGSSQPGVALARGGGIPYLTPPVLLPTTIADAMKHVRVRLERLDEAFHFRATNAHGHTVDMDDASSSEDGRGKGVGPMELLVMAAGGCSGIDVVSILQKGRQRIDTFAIEVEGAKPTGVSPSLYQHIHLHYILTGDLDPARVRRAVALSLGKYCSVSKTLEKTARITASCTVNGERFDAWPEEDG